MERKKKICKWCEQEQYIFSHGLCKRCYYIPAARSKVHLKPNKALSPKSKGKHRTGIKTLDFGYNSQLEMFFSLWDKYPRDKEGRMFCEFTGMRIDTFEDSNMWINCFSHILPKGLYPSFKLNPDNLRIVHPNFHFATEFYTSDMKEKCPDWDFDKWFALVEEMKKLYQTFVK